MDARLVQGTLTGAPELSAAPRIAPHERLPALDGLRFIAALAILIAHSCAWLAPFRDFSGFIVAARSVDFIAMPLFFVLSGFVIHFNYARSFATMPLRAAARDFFIARFARLYPLFAFALIMGTLVDNTLSWITSYPTEFCLFLIHNLTLTQSWFYIRVFDRLLLYNGFGLGWSISTEFFFYLVYIIGLFSIVTIKSRRTLLLLATIVSLTALCAVTAAYFWIDEVTSFGRDHIVGATSLDEHSFTRWLFYYSPYSRIFEFAIGCVAAQLFIMMPPIISRSEHIAANVGLAFAIASIGLSSIINAPLDDPSPAASYVRFILWNFGSAPAIAILVFHVSRYKSMLSVALSVPLIVFLGEVSYSIYAIHTWVFRIFIRPTIPDFSILLGIEAGLRILFAITLTLIFATATYRIIEVPCRGRLRGLRSRSTNITSAYQARRIHYLALAGAACTSAAILAVYQFVVLPALMAPSP